MVPLRKKDREEVIEYSTGIRVKHRKLVIMLWHIFHQMVILSCMTTDLR